MCFVSPTPLRLAVFCLPFVAASAPAQVSYGPSRALIETIGTGLTFSMAVDMDGDGDTDVLAAERYGVRVLWWENDGSGSFSKAREWMTGDVYSEVVGLADHDLDGRPDVWLMEQDQQPETTIRRYQVARNNGSGSFEAPVLVLEDPRPRAWGSPVIADMDGNSRPDILEQEGLFLADASGAFTTPGLEVPSSTWEPGEMLWTERKGIAIADIDGDGLQDLLGHDFNSYFQLSRNLGPAGFSTPVQLIPDDDEHWVSGLDFCLRPGLHASDPVQLFLIEKNAATKVQTLRIHEIVSDFTTTEIASLSLPSGNANAVIDWTGVTCDPLSGRVLIGSFRYDPTKHFGREKTTVLHEVTVSGSTVSLTGIGSHAGLVIPLPPSMHDFDGDSVPDLLLPIPELSGVEGSAPDQILWYPGKATGELTSPPGVITRSSFAPRVFAVADLDADGSNELVIGSSSLRNYGFVDRIEILRKSGADGDFERLPIPHPRDRIEVVATVDIEGGFHLDVPGGHEYVQCSIGRPDFLVQTFDLSPSDPYSGTHRFEWLLQDDAGTFHLKPLTSESTGGLATVAHVDWDGDGIRDLIYQMPLGYANSGLLWRRGNGSSFGTASALVPEAVLANSMVPDGYFLIPTVPVADVDRDGDLDLVFSGTLLGGYYSYWFENDGAGSFTAIRKLAPGKILITPDLDGDGHVDFHGEGQLHLSRPGATLESRSFPHPNVVSPNEPFLDLDGDGDSDFLHSQSRTGVGGYQTLVWRENRGAAQFQPNGDFPDGLPLAPPRWASRDRAITGDLDGDGVPDLIVSSLSYPRLEWFPTSRVPEPPAFTAWMASNGLRGHSAGPLADPDDDGIRNWDEFAFGSNAAVSDPGHAGWPRIEAAEGGLVFTFERRIDAAATGLSYERERSIDLDEWLPWTGDGTSSPSPGNYERVRFPISSGPEREFFRVKIAEPINP